MNETLILNWNSKVRATDTVYVLGDFVFGDPISIVKRLNGFIKLLPGSHDKGVKDYQDKLKIMPPLMRVKIGGVDTTICHYALRTWPLSHWGSFSLFGHSHGRLEPIGKSWDVGVDNSGFFPLSANDIIEIMKNRPDNPNLVRKQESNNK
jgi:calcineurin-like phosphoesterase family protein